MSAARWQRLCEALEADGVPAQVATMPYSQERRGRVHHGVSRSVTLHLGAGWVLSVVDTWWSKNPDTWLGWVVELSGPDSITRGQTRTMKRVAEVVAAVRLYTEQVPAPRVSDEVSA